MTVNLDGATVAVYLEAPTGEVSLGEFSLRDGAVHGTDARGVSYHGNATAVGSGSVNIELTATIPAGTRIGEGLVTDAEEQHALVFFLDDEQVAGRRTKPILLSGLGLADVRFEVR